jgi:hypothetical protein
LIFGLSSSYSITLIVRSILAVSMSGVLAIQFSLGNLDLLPFYLKRPMKKSQSCLRFYCLHIPIANPAGWQ